MTERLFHIVSQFTIEGDVKCISPYGSGHINDTYKVETASDTYLLQRINHLVFKNVEGLTRNLLAVTDHLLIKLSDAPGPMLVPRSLPGLNGKYLVRDADGNWWRVFEFIPDSYSYDRVPNDEIAFEGGRAYGWFVKMLADFPGESLVETIPGFHHAGSRIGNFKNAVTVDAVGRVSGVKTLVDELMDRSQTMMRIHELGKSGAIPVRVTHNDTKINNVLFNAHNQGVCVIDLDTVMPGYVHFDFGDAIRTFTNTADEDERDQGKVSMNMNYYKAFAKGFLSQTLGILTKEELETLAFSAQYITYEQTIRFFTDYLEGDQYYKIKFPDHNLVRTKAQFMLLECMEANAGAMEAVISETMSL